MPAAMLRRMAIANRMNRALARLDRIPAGLRPWARSLILGRVVPFVGTAGVRVERLDAAGCELTLAPRRRVQNHIKGVHAAATALLAETATGFAFGVHLPDDKLPLFKHMHIDYVKRATGALRAVAHLTPYQVALMQREPKGDVTIACTVTDAAGIEPVKCTMVWAWIPKAR
jgi:acyl-coenzyme A thioesterase PaaI-like protein